MASDAGWAYWKDIFAKVAIGLITALIIAHTTVLFRMVQFMSHGPRYSAADHMPWEFRIIRAEEIMNAQSEDIRDMKGEDRNLQKAINRLERDQWPDGQMPALTDPFASMSHEVPNGG